MLSTPATLTISLVLFAAITFSTERAQASESVSSLQTRWAHINYEMESDKAEAFTQLIELAKESTRLEPDNVELLIWQAIIQSTFAGESGGFRALGAAKEAKATFELTLEMDPNALAGSAHASLGTLYHKVPGWPIGFGSDKKARRHLLKALEISPDGIENNFFMAEFLFEEGEMESSRDYLLKALAAPSLVGRPVADAGRRALIQQLLEDVESRLR